MQRAFSIQSNPEIALGLQSLIEYDVLRVLKPLEPSTPNSSSLVGAFWKVDKVRCPRRSPPAEVYCGGIKENDRGD